MIVMLERSSSRLSLEISVPSISTLPAKGSRIRSKLSSTVDFPLPVLPTMPIFSLDLILTVKFLSAGSSSNLYLTEQLMN